MSWRDAAVTRAAEANTDLLFAELHGDLRDAGYKDEVAAEIVALVRAAPLLLEITAAALAVVNADARHGVNIRGMHTAKNSAEYMDASRSSVDTKKAADECYAALHDAILKVRQ
jgi:hypothetical protein